MPLNVERKLYNAYLLAMLMPVSCRLQRYLSPLNKLSSPIEASKRLRGWMRGGFLSSFSVPMLVAVTAPLESELPWALGFAGVIYGVTVAICGALFLILAFQLGRSIGPDRRPAHRLFVFSIFYLFVLFAAFLVDHGDNLFSRMRASHTGLRTSVYAEPLPKAVRTAWRSR